MSPWTDEDEYREDMYRNDRARRLHERKKGKHWHPLDPDFPEDDEDENDEE